MQNFYLDANGRCLGSYDGPIEQCPLSGTTVSVPPEDASKQIWNRCAWEWPVEATRQRLIEEIEARYETALAEGLGYLGGVVQIREPDQANLSAAYNDAVSAKSASSFWPQDFAWRLLDNTFLSLPSAEAMLELGAAARTECDRLRRVKWEHVDSVRSFKTNAELLNYNIETGWIL